ncbi:epoxide hydrolase 1-like [Tubulanus polymorphus]|uniref:epoxide hydrolase 1-like n=1 Tax=Tubulanus polymorphus TaxID=672921 RepID=UPI003DA26127
MSKNPILLRLIAYCIGAFWSVFVCLHTCVRFIKNPTGLFRKVDHKKSKDLYDTTEWSHKYLKLNEVKIHYVEAGDAEKPLMLFVHGFPEFWYSWRYQLRKFKENYRVVALDQRGYGESDKPNDIDSYNIRKLTGDLKELIEGLGSEKCYLVGHDWGGAVAWAFTYQYPQMVEKLIIMNCPHSAVFQKHMMQNLSQFLKSWYMFFFQMPWIPEFLLSTNDYGFIRQNFAAATPQRKMGMRINPLNNEEIENYKYTFSQPGALVGPLNYYRAAFQTAPLLVKKIERPVLVIWGDSDGALETQLAVKSLEFCEEGRLKIIEGCSHWVQQDAWQTVNSQMEDFLSIQ